MSDLDRRLAEVASTQRMLVTLHDVTDAGGTAHHAKTRLDAGRYRPAERGVYLLNGAPFDWHTRMLATTLAAGDGAVASHLAAARIHGIPGFAYAGVELSVPRGCRFRRSGVRVHESTDLDRCTIRRVDGVPVTDPARTLLDLARYVPEQKLARSTEWCRRNDLVTWSDLIATLYRHARRGRHGVRRLRHVILAGAHRDEITDSDFEFLVLSLLLEHGLPEPALHHRVYDGERFVAEVDLAYPQHRVAIECDGDLHRDDPELWEADKAKRNDLNLIGWTVLEVSRKRYVSRPDAVLAEVRAALPVRR
jgi:hypothetical protein